MVPHATGSAKGQSGLGHGKGAAGGPGPAPGPAPGVPALAPASYSPPLAPAPGGEFDNFPPVLTMLYLLISNDTVGVQPKHGGSDLGMR